jgi:hypothetical protein
MDMSHNRVAVQLLHSTSMLHYECARRVVPVASGWLMAMLTVAVLKVECA